MKIDALDKQTVTGDTVESVEELTAGEANQFLKELHNIITSSGQTLSKINLNQLSMSMSAYASGGVMYEDFSTLSNIFILKSSGSFKSMPNYFENMIVIFRSRFENGGGEAMININGIGLKNILDERGKFLRRGAIAKNQITVLIYDGNNFIIPSWSDNNAKYLSRAAYPQVLSGIAGGFVQITHSFGTCYLGDGDFWMHRGGRIHHSEDYSMAERTFPTLPGRVYHIRWTPSSGFMMKDLGDANYNPASLPENNVKFDTDSDDMLIARLVTDINNNAIITILQNKEILLANGLFAIYNSAYEGVNSSVLVNTKSINLNWGRRIAPCLSGYSGANNPDGAHALGVAVRDRYHFVGYMQGFVPSATFLEFSARA